MKKIILTASVLISLISCTKEPQTNNIALNEPKQTIQNIVGTWNLSHKIFENYYIVRDNNLYNRKDTVINENLFIDFNNWGDDKVLITWIGKEMNVNFVDTNKHFVIQQYFENKMIVQENETTTSVYLR